MHKVARDYKKKIQLAQRIKFICGPIYGKKRPVSSMQKVGFSIGLCGEITEFIYGKSFPDLFEKSFYRIASGVRDLWCSLRWLLH